MCALARKYIMNMRTAVAPRLSFAMSPPLSQAMIPSPSASPRPKVIVITGPTAVGKSATAVQLCHRLNGEIISADSVQLYKYLDIASNKATTDERNAVPHHLLDIADPAKDEFSAGNFYRAASAAIQDVLSRGRLPVVVGGTMMYVRWLIHGRPATPPAPPKTKKYVKELLDSFGGDWEAALAHLSSRDPKRADMLSQNDWYRLGRALEVLETTGTGVTELPLRGAAPKAEIRSESLPDLDFRCFFLYSERVPLNRRIDQRCEYMILPYIEQESGATNSDWNAAQLRSVLHEVATLLLSSRLRVASASPCLAIGYRQTLHYLIDRALAYRRLSHIDQNALASDEALGGISDEALSSFRSFVDDFQASTRGYAKQQISWFRKEEGFIWIEADNDTVNTAEELTHLSEAEYHAFGVASKEHQQSMREGMIAQGKLMKTYISEKKWLVAGSRAETKAVLLAEKRARELSEQFTQEQLEQMRNVVT